MSDGASEESMTPTVLKQAMKAFKKRLKLTRLDAESTLGGGPFSGGRSSGIVIVGRINAEAGSDIGAAGQSYRRINRVIVDLGDSKSLC